MFKLSPGMPLDGTPNQTDLQVSESARVLAENLVNGSTIPGIRLSGGIDLGVSFALNFYDLRAFPSLGRIEHFR
jgi:hypothetical protein